MARVEVITGPERRRRWSDEQKRAIVAASLEPGAVVADVARRAEVGADQISDTLGGEHVPADQLDQRGQTGGAGADPIGQGRHVKIDAFTGTAFALPIERLMFAELGVQDHR